MCVCVFLYIIFLLHDIKCKQHHIILFVAATEPGSPKSSDHNQHAPNTQPEENNKRKMDESHEHSLPPKKKKAITPHNDVTVVDVESAIEPSMHEGKKLKLTIT